MNFALKHAGTILGLMFVGIIAALAIKIVNRDEELREKKKRRQKLKKKMLILGLKKAKKLR